MKSCIILCGGQSRRMGRDKGSMIIKDKPMINHILQTLDSEVDEVTIVLNTDKRIEKYREFIDVNNYTYKVKFIKDKIKNKGPLSGILTGLENIHNNHALILPCDSPYVSKKYINTMFCENKKKYQAIVPHHNKDKLKSSEPLHSIYNKNIIPIIEELINENKLSIKELIKKIDTKFILIDNEKIEKKEFKNLNYQKDI